MWHGSDVDIKSCELGGGITSKRIYKLIFAFGISAAIVIWLYFAINWQEVLQEFKKVHTWPFLTSGLIIILHYFIRALRWRYLLPKLEQQPSVLSLFECLMLGNFATFVLPLRAGEFVRPLALTRFSQHSFSTAFASVVVERFFDLATVLLSFAIVVNYVPDVPDLAIKGAYILGSIALFIFVFVALGSLFPDLIKKINVKLTAPLPEKLSMAINKFLDDLLKAVVVIRDPANLFTVMVLTLIVWASGYYVFYEFCFLFDIQPTFWMAITLGVLVALAVAAPSAPGFVGVYQAGCIAGFALFGVSKEIGAAYSIVTHLFQFLLFVAIAIIILFAHNMKFSELTRKA